MFSPNVPLSNISTEVSRSSGLPREVLKWIQSLDLSYPVKNIRRDFSNGFLVAEIFSWYYPKDIQMHSYDNGISLPTKLGNWSQLERFFVRKNLDIQKEVVSGTIHCKNGAAELLVQTIYSILTNRMLRSVKDDGSVDFSDRYYQIQLPMHARSTASQALKNNLKITEFITQPNILTNKSKAETIIQQHLEHRSVERMQDPDRFNIRPSIGELALRKPPPIRNDTQDVPQPSGQIQQEEDRSNYPSIYKEIHVDQMNQVSQVPVRPGNMYATQSPILSQ